MEVENYLERCMVRRDELDLSLWIVLEEVIHICDASPKVTLALGIEKGVRRRNAFMVAWIYGIQRFLKRLPLARCPWDKHVANRQKPLRNFNPKIMLHIDVKIRIFVGRPIEKL